MSAKLLGSAGLALVLTLPSGAWAGSDNILSNGNTTATTSEAHAIGNNNKAVSESYNTSIEAVASQTLTSTVTGTTVQMQGDGLIHAGNAYAGTGGGTVNGVAQAAANSGIGGIVQQGLVMATSAPVKF